MRSDRSLRILVVLASVDVAACGEPRHPGAAPRQPPPCPACPIAAAADAAPPPRACDEQGPPQTATTLDAGPPAPTPEWTPAPAGSATLLFREVYVGMLPFRQRRTTWTLIQAGTAILLRVEDQIAKTPFTRLDRTSTFPEGWHAAERSEYAGKASAASPPFTVTLNRSFGVRTAPDLVLTCAARTIPVHPALAALVEGWQRMDDTMEPAVWAPPRTENVGVLACKGGGDRTFGDGLSFARPRKETTTDPRLVGVEWAHVNSDMVIQEGGYRWITSFSMP
jgi:hypothetical protein